MSSPTDPRDIHHSVASYRSADIHHSVALMGSYTSSIHFSKPSTVSAIPDMWYGGASLSSVCSGPTAFSESIGTNGIPSCFNSI